MVIASATKTLANLTVLGDEKVAMIRQVLQDNTTVLITTNGRHDRCYADRCARVARRAVRQALDECSRNPRAKRCNRMCNMSLNTNWESRVVVRDEQQIRRPSPLSKK
jgi:hypothetical protein